mgnify:CR=1 FL=1
MQTLHSTLVVGDRSGLLRGALAFRYKELPTGSTREELLFRSARRARARPLVEVSASRAFFGWDKMIFSIHAIVAEEAERGFHS